MTLGELTVETPEVENWVIKYLDSCGVRLTSFEGYSVNNNIVTALFERRCCGGTVKEWDSDALNEWFVENEDLQRWIDRTLMADLLKAPLYLVLWKDKEEFFRMFSVSIKSLDQMKIVHRSDYRSCTDFALFLNRLKGIPVKKAYEEMGRLASIDNCLRREGVPWPGNLDGFLVGSDEKSIDAVFEFSRTRKTPVKNHDIRQFFRKDVNRWRPPDILRRQLDCDFYIVLWSSEEDIVKTQKVKSVTDNLYFELDTIVKKSQLESFFKGIARS